MARPSKYEQEWKDKLEVIEGWARDGLTNEQIAHNIGISAKTLYEWQNKYSEFRNALKKGKEVIDREVENMLLQKCRDGNMTAIIFWLKNRKPDQWRDRRTHAVEGDTELNVNIKGV